MHGGKAQWMCVWKGCEVFISTQLILSLKNPTILTPRFENRKEIQIHMFSQTNSLFPFKHCVIKAAALTASVTVKIFSYAGK